MGINFKILLSLGQPQMISGGVRGLENIWQHCFLIESVNVLFV